jgi:hypothetical protein
LFSLLATFAIADEILVVTQAFAVCAPTMDDQSADGVTATAAAPDDGK